MKQHTLDNGIIELRPEEGMMLKSGSTYSDLVWLGRNDSPDNWTEVPYSEYEEWQRQEEARMAEEMGEDYQPQDPEPIPVDLTELEAAKAAKIKEIEEYDTSDAVNVFIVNGLRIWLDKAMRVGLAFRLESERAEGKTETTLWWQTTPFTIPIDFAISMLHRLEVYASETYDCTQQHKAEVEALETVEAVENYDYKSGYPEPISITI